MSFTVSLIIGFIIEAKTAWPNGIYRKVGHPVSWIGRLITKLERVLNHPDQSQKMQNLRGALTVMVVVIAAFIPAWAISFLLPKGALGGLIGGICAWPFLATRSLYDHVAAVAVPLQSSDTQAARQAISMIVGRDPEQLDDAGITRAALESLAENASDGVVAPLFWGVCLGLPGLVVYKAINTLDSMIGHRSPRYETFGMVAARLDDLVNLIPARLTGILFSLVSGHPRQSLVIMLRDARYHRSPNAGWPEAAMAGALNIRLSGPRTYGDDVADESWLNGECPDPDGAVLGQGLALYRRSMIVLLIGLMALVFI